MATPAVKKLPAWAKPGAKALLVSPRNSGADEIEDVTITRTTETSVWVRTKTGNRETRFIVPRWGDRLEEWGAQQRSWNRTDYLLDLNSAEAQTKAGEWLEWDLGQRTRQALSKFVESATVARAERARLHLDEYLAYYAAQEEEEETRNGTEPE